LRGAASHPATTQPRNRATSEAGFTLAAVLVLLSILMVFVAYTVPKQWSAIRQRDREQQTIFAMKQYARACLEFQRKHQTYPVSVNQLKEARSPRMIRGFEGELVDPLTGEVDWLVIPQSQAVAPGQVQPGVVQGGGANPNNPNAPPPRPGIPIKDYAGGPFVGVRPPVTGKAMVTRIGDTYETWNYTALDLQRDIQLRMVGLQTVWK
jgi:type II secretory pathway pseudopilin PulG